MKEVTHISPRYWVKAVYKIITLGYVNVKRALVSGQYSRPDAVYYGGQELQASHARVLEFLGRAARAGVVPDARRGRL